LLGVVLYLVIEGPEINRVAGAGLFFVISYFALWFIRGQSVTQAIRVSFVNEPAGMGRSYLSLKSRARR
jgi:hypothetical protein